MDGDGDFKEKTRTGAPCEGNVRVQTFARKRRGRDSNPRAGLSPLQHFQCCSFSRSDTSPGSATRNLRPSYEVYRRALFVSMRSLWSPAAACGAVGGRTGRRPHKAKRRGRHALFRPRLDCNVRERSRKRDQLRRAASRMTASSLSSAAMRASSAWARASPGNCRSASTAARRAIGRK